MTDARIVHAFPDLPEHLARVALLGETFRVSCQIKISRQEIDAAEGDAEQVKELIALLGFPEDMAFAEEAATATILELLTLVSEQDLEEGRDQGLLAPEDFEAALKVKRSMALERGRVREAEAELER